MPDRPAPAELTEDQAEELRRTLEDARASLEAQLEATRDDVKPVAVDEPIGRLTRMDAMQQQSMAKASRRTAEARLAQVNGALTALRAGDYGFCSACEEPIGYRRLKAQPESRLCRPCQELRERRG